MADRSCGRWRLLAVLGMALVVGCTSQPPVQTVVPTATSQPAAAATTPPPTNQPTSSTTPLFTPPATSSTAPPPEHRIGVREGDGIMELYDRATGERFTPRGNNLIRLDSYHNTFNPGSYNAADLDAQLATMASLGYNVVRVFLDHRRGGLTDSDLDGGLSAGYVDNLVDFLQRARAYGLYVMFTQDWLPEGHRYEIPNQPDVAGININFLTQAGIDQNAHYFADLASALIERGAPLDAIWSYELRNELFLDVLEPPFSLDSGQLTAPNGMTYDLADAAQRRALLEDGLVHWIDQVRAAIVEVDPTALVSVGFFVPQGPNPVREGDSRIIETREVIARSSADFIDLHAYPGPDLTLPLHMENFGVEPPYAKPVVMGEMGAFLDLFPKSDDGLRALIRWQAESCDYGLDGWLLWTWDAGGISTGVWNGTADDGLVAYGLAPVNRPDPCSSEGGAPANLAFEQPVRTSREVGDSPGSFAVDGIAGTIWNSGDYAPQWIEVELAEPVSAATVRLTVSQYPAGETRHRVFGRSAAGERLLPLQTFRGETNDSEVLSFDFADLAQPISMLRIETGASPSWVAWREIEVIAAD